MRRLLPGGKVRRKQQAAAVQHRSRIIKQRAAQLRIPRRLLAGYRGKIKDTLPKLGASGAFQRHAVPQTGKRGQAAARNQLFQLRGEHPAVAGKNLGSPDKGRTVIGQRQLKGTAHSLGRKIRAFGNVYLADQIARRYSRV